jgi:hypothetical protein
MAEEVKNIPVVLKRDYWIGPGRLDKTTGNWVDDRRKAGETLMVSRAEALRMIEHNVADRADPLP